MSRAFDGNLSASPDPNGGDFIVTWSNPGEYEYDLQESFNGGGWNTVVSTAWYVSHDFVDKTPGSYAYRLRFGHLLCTGFPEPTCYPYQDYSETIQVTVVAPPPVPGGLSGPATDHNGAYTISWNASSGATSYKLQEKSGSGSWSQIHSGASRSKNVSGRSPGSYSYRVMACESPAICSNWSSARTVNVAAPPSTPTGLTGPADDYNGAYTLSWNAAARASTYRLEERFGSGSWHQIHHGGSRSKSVSGNAPGRYRYRVRGCNVEAVCGNWSATRIVDVAAPPAIPGGLTGPATSESGTYTISWNTSARATSYRLQEQDGSESWEQIYSGTGTARSRTSLPPDTYRYRVRGCNVESICSGWSATHTVVVPEPPPPATTWLPTDASDFPDAAVFNPAVPAGDTVGAVEGTGGVSGGSATYRIPITVPPGRRGVQPKVSLSYSSSSGNGVVGVGWHLNAGSAITRCPATPAQDGFTAAVQYDAVRDRLCLDGRRLVVVSGLYGQSGARYRTELDIFARVTQNGSLNGTSTSFTVEFKDGRVSQYGATLDSRHSAAGRSEVLTWAISETQDRADNTITYDYQTFGAGEHLLTAIHYTGINGSDGNRHVRFTYENRGDFRTSYLAGGKTRATKRLKTITTEYQSSPVREYTLSYGAKSASSGRSLLRSITDCGYDNGIEHCLPATQLTWQEHAPRFVSEALTFKENGTWTTFHADKRWLNEVMPHGDTNGDGVKDWPGVYVNAEGEVLDGTGASQLANCFRHPGSFTLTCLEADFNADGLTDSFRQHNGKLELRFTEGGSWFSTGIDWLTGPSGFADTPLGFADFNGDGWVDIAFKQNAKLWVYFHTSNRNVPYSTAQRQWLLDYPMAASGTSHAIDVQVYGDMDGNGTPDFVVSSLADGSGPPGLPTPGYIILTQSNPGGTMSTSTRNVPTISGVGYNANFFHDVNGDGLPDLVALHPTWRNLAYRLNDGTGFPGPWIDLGVDIPTRHGMYDQGPSEPEPYIYPVMSKLLVMDYDGDGRDEILFADTVLASACALVFDLNGDTWKCDDDLYKTYQANPHSNYGAPINGSVKDNSVRRYTAHKFVESASGAITVTTFATDIVASASQTAVVDATGDGLADVVTVFGCRQQGCEFNTETSGVTNPAYTPGAWINRNLGTADPGDPNNRYEGYDLMSAVENGVGLRHEWTYRPLSSDEYDDSASSPYYHTERWYEADDPDYFHFASSMYVVADHRVSNGVCGMNNTRYRYRGAIYNNKGRGFQGFRSIIVEENVFGAGDPQANTDKVTRTDFYQKWPLSSQIDQSCTWLATDAVTDDNPDCLNVLSKTTVDTIHNVATAGGARFVAVEKKTERVYDLSSRLLLTTRIVDRNFDSVGNITFESLSHSDAWTANLTETTRNFATPDYANWWLNKLQSKTVEHYPVSQRHGTSPAIAPGTDGVKRITTVFSQYNAVRLPEKVTTSGNVSPLTKEVLTDYNPRGLPIEITTSGTGVTGTRTVITTYSDNGVVASASGYFPFSVTNTLGHVTQTDTDPATGQPIAVTDPNGLVSTTAYDGFGRPSAIAPAGKPTQSVRWFWCNFSCPPGAAYYVATYAAGAPQTRTYFDLLSRERQSSVRNFADSGFINVRTDYNQRGLKAFVSEPYDPAAGDSGLLGTRYLSYDALGRVQSKERDQANGTIFLTSYSYNGFTTSINASGLLMHRIYNGLAQLVETGDAMGGITRYAYDGAGNPIVLQDPLGNEITASYNAFGHKLWVDDPNMGAKTFDTNALGEVLSTTDANGDTVSRLYDELGRLRERRVNGTLTGSWHYDNPAADKGLGLLDYEDNHAVRDGEGLRKEYFYSPASSGRKVLTKVLHRFYDGSLSNDINYEVRYYTDSYYGRPKGIRYPGGVGVAFVYNSGGYLVLEKDASSNYIIRQVNARDSRNQVIQSSLANGSLTHTAQYYTPTGQMKGITVTGTSGTVHDLDYSYDLYGNLASRSTAYPGGTATETFYYDPLHRLTQSSRSYPGGSKTVNYDYDAGGNLTLKDDYATHYSYSPGRPNAVASVTLVAGGTVNFSYDANGNMTTGDGKTLAYNAHNKPITITSGGVTADFYYGADLVRFKQVKSSGETIRYIGKLMEIVDTPSGWEYRHYLSDAAILTKSGTLQDEYPIIRYLHRGRLGSVITITDETGIAEKRGFDPFGKPRDGDWREKTSPVIGSAITDRGFTGHEHLDESQLIHMNGRVYDYNLGRFLSVDPVIQAPGNSQSLNPYSYIMNNPLAGVDPSGYACVSKSTASDCLKDLKEGEIDGVVNSDGKLIGFITKGKNGDFAITNNNGVSRVFGSDGKPKTTLNGPNGSIDSIGSQHSSDTDFVGQVAAFGKLVWEAAKLERGQILRDAVDNTGDFLDNVIGVPGLGHHYINATSGPIIGDLAELADGKVSPELAASIMIAIVVKRSVPNKIPTPRMKSSPFGPKIEDPIPNGVPRNWSRDQIEDAMTDYRTSLTSRRDELAAFDSLGGGSATQRLAHARRITQEEDFLRSLEKAYESRR